MLAPGTVTVSVDGRRSLLYSSTVRFALGLVVGLSLNSQAEHYGGRLHGWAPSLVGGLFVGVHRSDQLGAQPMGLRFKLRSLLGPAPDLAGDEC